MDPLININDYLKATDDAAAQEPIDPNKFDELMGALVHAINNDLLRTDGAQEPTEDQNYAGHNVNDILNITGVDSTDQRRWRLHYDEVNHVLTFQENTGTNTSPIWQDRFSFELDAAPQVLLRDNTGLKFPDGSQIHSTDFDSSGYVKLTTAQGDIEFDSLILGGWTIKQDTSGNLEISHVDLDRNYIFNTDNELLGIKLENRTSDPSVTAADAGRMWIRTDL